jgi:aspartyl protease family protein
MAMGFMGFDVRRGRVLRALCLLAALPWSWVPDVFASATLSGVLGEKALISVNGSPPKVMAVGDSHLGVKLLAVRGQQAEIEEAGRRRLLNMGVSGGGAMASKAARTILTADGRGHFSTLGEVNGSATRFLVDTGASLVALPLSVAKQAGVNLDNAQQVGVNTANGQARAYRVMLNSIRVGDVRANMVEALIMEDRQLPISLLGMSFLNRVNMNREGDLLTLSQRY